MIEHTVVVVEDSASTRQALVRLLESAGHVVRVAGTVFDAIPMLDGSDTVILDLCLPDGSGRIVFEAARRQRAPVRIAIWSALDRSAVDGRLRGLFPDAVFSKTFATDPEVILAWVASRPHSPRSNE